MALSFRPIARADFPMLSAWLQTQHVARWWADDPSLKAIESDYGGCIDGTEAAEVFIACLDAQAVGLIQRYRLGAYPQYIAEMAHIVAAAPDVSSIDYLVGPVERIGKGVGTAMIAAFCDATWRDDALTPAILVPVQADNHASWRALERAGFERIAEGELAPDNPIDGPRHFLYRLERPAS